MHKINRSNYEVFLIDLMEGQLSKEVEQEVLLFLEKNPDIAEEFDGLAEMTIPNIEEQYPRKNSLKHASLPTTSVITYENYEAYFVRSIDQDLSKAEQKELLLFLQLHPELSSEYALFQKTVSEADKTILFPNPKVLKDISIEPFGFVNAQNYEEAFIAYHEGSLDAQQQKEVARFVALYPHTQESFDTLGKVYFVADQKVVYPNKAELKQKVIARKISMYRMQRIAVAATVAFVFFFSWMYLNEDKNVIEYKGIAKRSAHQYDWSKVKSNNSDNSLAQNDVNEQVLQEASGVSQSQSSVSKQNTVVAQVEDMQPTLQKNRKDLPLLRALASDAIPQSEITLNYSNAELKPMFEGMQAQDNIWQYASAQTGFLRAYYDGMKDNIRDRLNNEQLQDEGVDLWDIAKITVMSFNELTENEYRIARNDN